MKCKCVMRYGHHSSLPSAKGHSIRRLTTGGATACPVMVTRSYVEDLKHMKVSNNNDGVRAYSTSTAHGASR